MRSIVSPSSSTKTRAADAICPFCALLCDDLRVQQRADGSLSVKRGGCARADAAFALPPADPAVLLDGTPVSVETAAAAIARRLRRARQPLIAGLASDVDGTRAAVDLGARYGAILDHVHGDALAATTAVLQQRGFYATTQSEVRNRADFVLLLDLDRAERYQNFAARCLRPASHLRGRGAQTQQLGWLGRSGRRGSDVSPDIGVDCRADGLGDALTALLAMIRGKSADAARYGGAARKSLRELADAMQAAEYCAIVLAPAQLDDARAVHLATVADIVDALNISGRAALMTLGGDDGGQSATATTAWLTGYPLRCALGRTIRYEPAAYRADDLIAAGTVDALVWIDAYGFHPEPPPGVDPSATVVLGRETPRNAQALGAFIRVGTPGLDHRGRLLRNDAVVSLALPALRESGLPSVSQVLRNIGAAG